MTTLSGRGWPRGWCSRGAPAGGLHPGAQSVEGVVDEHSGLPGTPVVPAVTAMNRKHAPHSLQARRPSDQRFGLGPSEDPDEVDELKSEVPAEKRLPARQWWGLEVTLAHLHHSPCWILKPHPPGKGEASPGSSVQLEEPRSAVDVAEKLEHEEPAPGYVPEHRFGTDQKLRIGSLADARARTGTLRVGHAN